MIVIDIYTQAFLKQAGILPNSVVIDAYRPIFWWNIRKKSSGLRLTEEAMTFIIANGIKTYEIDFPDQLEINFTLLLWLDRNLKTPYYITKKTITVLDELSAIEIYLFAGDIANLGQSRTMSKKMKEMNNK